MLNFYDSLGDKLVESQIVNVALYGAKGNGTSDDTTAIQNALNDCVEGDVLYFPYGTYVISSALLIKSSNLHIDFNGSTILHKTGTSFNCMMRNYAHQTSGFTGIHDITIENGTFDGNGYVGNLTQLGFIHGTNIITRNCRFVGTEDTGSTWHHIEYNAVKYGLIENCYFEGKRGASYEMIQLGDAYGSLGWPWDDPTWDNVGCTCTEIKGCHFVDDGYATAVGWHGTTAPTYTNLHDCTCENIATIMAAAVAQAGGITHNNITITTT